MSDNELRSFIKYMSSLWALLAGITVVFPLSDVLLDVIPLPVDAYQKSTAPVAIPVTTLVTLFTLFYTFVQRDKSQYVTVRQSCMFFMLGLSSLIVFFLLEHFEEPLRVNFLPFLDSSDDYVLLLVAVVPFYVCFFACITRAFTVLALMEFIRKRRLTNRPSGYS